MATLRDFERQVRVALDGSKDELRQELAQTAHESLDEVISSGEASPHYQRFVNGRSDVPEESVDPPGPIVYVFDYQAEIARFAIDWARANSPVQSGRFRDAWFCLANGAEVDPDQVPEGATILISNDQPYARKIEVGAQKVSVPPHIVERLRQAVQDQYPFVQCDVQFVELAGGYVLKGNKKGRRRGQQVLYPALQVSVP